MNNSKIENVQPEQVMNNELNADEKQVSPSIANANVVRSLSKDEILDKMCDEMPFSFSDKIRPYVKQAMQIYTDQQLKKNSESSRRYAEYFSLTLDGAKPEDAARLVGLM